MKRSEFLKLAGAGMVATVFPVGLFSKEKHVLYGDGKHDDTLALQAWFNGEDVEWPDGTPVGNRIEGKRFIIHDTVHVDSSNIFDQELHFTNNVINTSKPNGLMI